jgi:hypothetical protein
MAIISAALAGFVIVALLGLGRPGRLAAAGALAAVALGQALFVANYDRGRFDWYNFEGRTIVAFVVLLAIDAVVLRAAASALAVWRPSR